MDLRVSVKTGKTSRGFSLTELLVVLSILGIVTATALPKIIAARSSQRRSQCANNQHLIGLAFLGFVDTTNVFPNAATYGEIPGVKTAAAVNESIINYAFLNNSAKFGTYIAANPAKGLPTDIGPLYSWVVDLLPYLDAQSLYNDYNRSRVYWDNGRTGDDPSRPTNLTIASTSLPILSCLEDTTLLKDAGNLSYVVNGGSRAGMAFRTAGSAAGLAARPATPLTGRPWMCPRRRGCFSWARWAGGQPGTIAGNSTRSSTAARPQ